MYLLRPALRRYDWGSPDALPAFLGFESDGQPYAEAWWGAHSASPAMAHVADDWHGLDTVIADDPVVALGPEVIAAHGESLPYLLKVLAIARPLSIQVHPSAEEARQGFAREDAEGVPRDAPQRVFRDTSRKPEMVVAITPMVLLSGLRPGALIAADLARLGGSVAARLSSLLSTGGTEPLGLAAFLKGALTDPEVTGLIPSVVREGAKEGATPSMVAAATAAASFPHDPGVIVALAMNVVSLDPCDACFTPDDTVHSYLSGVGLEIMANSDNVIRAGLTTKHIDVPALLQVVRTTPSEATRPRETRDGACVTYGVPAGEFQLTVVSNGSDSFDPGPTIALVLEGEGSVRTRADETTLGRGEAVFVPHADGEFTVSTSGRVAVARVPRPTG